MLLGCSAASARAPRAPGDVALRRGINVTQWESSAWFGAAEPARIRCLGFDFVRLHVDPLRLHGRDSLHYLRALDATLLSLQQADLSVIAVLRPGEPADARARTATFMRAALLHLGGHVQEDQRFGRVMLESWNEPPAVLDTGTGTTWRALQESLVVALDPLGRQGRLVLTAPDGALDSLVAAPPIGRAPARYDFHFYAPFHFTHQGADWGWWASTYYPRLRDIPYPSALVDTIALARPARADELPGLVRQLSLYRLAAWDHARIEAEIGRARDWAERWDMTLLVGEFGALSRAAPSDSRARWIRDVRLALEKHHIPWAYWRYADYPGGFGLRDLQGQWDTIALQALDMTCAP